MAASRGDDMSLTPMDTDLNIIQALSNRPNATEGLSAAALKAKFDEGPNALKTYINSLITILNSTTDGSSGADNIGATAISGLSGTTVQSLIESLKALVDTNDDNITTNRLLSEDGNFTGSWFGVTNPAASEPGIQGQVDLNTENIASQLLKQQIQGSIPYGEIVLTDYIANFPDVGFDLYRDSAGVVQHTFDVEQYKTGTIIYCDPTSGNDTTGDGTSGNPYKTLSKCITVANAGGDASYQIYVKAKRVNRGSATTNITITNKTIAILPDPATSGITPLIFSNHNSGLAWSSLGSGTWRATRSSVYSVYDLRHTDVFGVPIPFEYKSSLAEVQATTKSWWEDGTFVYVHTIDDFTPTDTNIVVNVTGSMFDPTLMGSTLLVQDSIFIGSRSSQDNRPRGDATGATQSTFVAKNCKFIGEGYRLLSADVSNSLSILDITNAYLIDCIAAYGGEDGFNYHYSTPNRGTCLAVEIDCKSYRNGHHSTTKTSNSTTGHDGVNILRIRSIGYESKGPVLADVNGCKTICIDCHMRDALDGTTATKAAYYFDNSSALTDGKAVLINCDGGGTDTYSVNAASGFDITMQACRGTNFPSGFSPTTIP